MATKKKAQVEETEVDELDELDDLEDLADEEDEVEDEDVEEEDEDEAPARKSKAKTSKAKAKPAKDTVGSAELADALGTSGRELRVMLRQKKVSKNENNRYEWASVEDALEALGFDDLAEAQEALKESRTQRLDELKSRVEKSKKSKGKGKKAAPADDDEDDDEDEEPAPKKKTRRK